jgi:hypothetical protein
MVPVRGFHMTLHRASCGVRVTFSALDCLGADEEPGIGKLAGMNR